jgi:hypothetical protein
MANTARYNNDLNNFQPETFYHHNNFTLIIRRSTFGNNNGYIVLPPTHRFSGVHYDNINDDNFIKDNDIHIHGGFTYSAQEEHGWTIGFDTSHLFDFVPLIPHADADDNDAHHYWTHQEVLNELINFVNNI